METERGKNGEPSIADQERREKERRKKRNGIPRKMDGKTVMFCLFYRYFPVMLLESVDNRLPKGTLKEKWKNRGERA